MFRCLPDSAWADGNLAEAAGQLGQMVEHRNQSQPNPGLREHATPLIIVEEMWKQFVDVTKIQRRGGVGVVYKFPSHLGQI